MKVGDTTSVTIAGAGLAGTLLAVLLAERGFTVDLFERNPDPREGGAAAGRSINLALGERGRHALRLAGLLETVDRFTIPMRGRLLHDPAGRLSFQPYGAREEEVIWSVHREKLNRTLLDAAEATGRVRLHFRHELASVDWDARRLVFTNGAQHDFPVLIGADGGGSAVRRAMDGRRDLGVSEELLDHGYRELTFPPVREGGFAMEREALHIWPRGGYMMIALPNVDGSFTGTLFLAKHGDTSFDALRGWPEQEDFFRRHFADALPLLGRLKKDFEDNPVGLLGTIRCRHWHLEGRAALLGDAAHAIVPFHGQGMNAAMEDCVALARLAENGDHSWQELFARYQAERIDNANAIADMALENYLIMREAVRDPRFLLRKALEHELERRFGERFVARYSLVMFHRVPYAECQARGAIQAELLDRLLADADRLEDVDFEHAGRQIETVLTPIEEPA